MKQIAIADQTLVQNQAKLTFKEEIEIAQKIYERHTLLSDFLIRLGVDPAIAAEDACKMEHDSSDSSFEAIKRHVNAQKQAAK